MLRLFIIPAILLCLILSLLLFATRAWGQAHPAPMLAYLSDAGGYDALWILDVSHQRFANLGDSITAFSRRDLPAWSADGRLAFVSRREGNLDIYVWDGASLTNITQTPDTDEYAVKWNPDGHLAFTGYHNEEFGVYTWDGVSVSRVSLVPIAHESSPAWSADGRLAFQSNSSGDYEIYVWDGEVLSNISQNPNSDDLEPMWSADGRLAYSTFNGSQFGLNVWNGTSREQIISASMPHALYCWSADGRLAFGFDSEIYVWDSAGLTNVSLNADTADHSPLWSGDGRLAFLSSDSQSRSEIYVWDGSSTENVSQTPNLSEVYFSWGADGRLAFDARASSYSYIYFRDGTAAINITQNLYARDYAPVWWTP